MIYSQQSPLISLQFVFEFSDLLTILGKEPNKLKCKSQLLIFTETQCHNRGTSGKREVLKPSKMMFSARRRRKFFHDF